VGTETGSAPVLDERQVTSTIGDDPGAIREFIDVAMQDIVPRVADLQAAAARDDQAGVQKTAHALKGVALSIGAMRLGSAFREIEQAARAADSGRIKDGVSGVGAELKALLDALAVRGWGAPP